ncbi:MAG TPA: hypothetical protein DEA08_32525 [Planctomycetes bacterium]|nr:hypothetical protein [Planctomycetota bacterium]
MAPAYTTRLQPVEVGEAARPLLVAVFPLHEGPGAVCFQLQDDGDLRRGGVYWLPADEAARVARAPRFDELFADVAAKLGAQPELQAPLRALLERARDVAKESLPLTPDVLSRLVEVGRAASELDPGDLPGVFPLEGLVLTALLIFVSEEERYPRPRYKGGDVALERFLDVIG